MEGIVGSMNWNACKDCKHYRPTKGGCKPMDEGTDNLLVKYDFVECGDFEYKAT